jgi:hypothetical protein
MADVPLIASLDALVDASVTGVLKPDDADFNVPVQSSFRSTSTGKGPHRAVSGAGPCGAIVSGGTPTERPAR